VIDLHTHTTASDGRAAPAELVARARAAGVTVLAVTDHDTLAGCTAAADACGNAGIEFVTGIEVSAVRDEVDVHVLGYFLDAGSPALGAFLAAQRQKRVDRVGRMLAKLAELGMPLDGDAILRAGLAQPGRSIGRPVLARALVAAGYVATIGDAFRLWLSRGRPGFVAREGPAPERVIAEIHAASGIASIAHPGLLGRDEWIDRFAAAGLDAIEVFHPEHDGAAVDRYRAIVARLDLAMTGGSDYHGDPSHGALHPGSVSLPRDHFDRLRTRWNRSTASRSH
jgi:predicted metal-dependent phosphoesterase TrpH